jgi:hypothetical protein
MRLAALALAGAALAANAMEGERRWYVQVDNDVVFHTDRWYTSGVRLACEKGGLELGIVQEIYTPDAKHWRPGEVDRIPTARLLASVARQLREADSFQTIELGLGVRGPSALGRQATEDVHRLIPAPEVNWSRQLPNRVDAHVAYTRTQAIGDGPLQAHFGAVLGNQVSLAHAGVELRFGARGTPGSPLLRFAPTPPWTSAPDYGWSARLGVSARAVPRNELLSRSYDPNGPIPERRDFVGRAAAGVAWTQPWGELTFDLAADTREFATQSHPGAFGALAVHVSF